MNKRIYLSPPYVHNTEKDFLLKAFESNWIAPIGPDIDDFEKEISSYLGVKSACALSSGTAALHLALKIIGIKENDRVICPSLTFAATSNAILYQNAEPIFIDSCPETWVLDLDVLDKAISKYNPKAIISVDLYGQSCDYNEIYELCRKNNVLIIEDAAEALGSKYKGEKCGSFGEIGILSFNGNKIITTSGGGMLVSKNEKYVNKARFLSTQARESFLHYEHKELGYNYRLSNLLAALGRGQLRRLDDFVSRRREIYEKYSKELSKIEGIRFIPQSDSVYSNRWLTTLTINPKRVGVSNIEIIQALEKENIESRPVWKPMHMQPLYKDYIYVKKKSCDVSKKLYSNGLCLPSGSCLTTENQNRILDIILSLIQ